MSIHELAFAKQTARGTAATAAAYRIPLVGGTVRPRRVVNVLEETSNSRLRNIAYVSEVGAEGTPEYALRPEPAALLYYAALGTVQTTGAADPYEHAITEAAEQPWLTFWRMLDNKVYEKLVDCKVVQLVQTSEKGQPVRVALTIMGLDPQAIESGDYATEVAVSESAGRPIMHYDGAGKFLVEGVAVSSIERIVTTINNQSSFQQGDAVRGYDVSEGMLAISHEVMHLIEDAAVYNRYHYGSATPSTGDRATKEALELAASGVDFEWEQVAAVPGPERSLRLASTRLMVRDLQGYEPNTGNEPLKETHTYEVLKPASGAGLTATVISGVATV